MNIAIVGCGPAGLCTAIALYDSGYAVTLFEQFDKPQPVGSGLMLQPTGLGVLGALGLRQQAENLGQRIAGMTGRLASSGRTVLDIKYRTLNENLYGVAIHRAALFQILFDSVRQRSIKIITSAKVTDANQTESKVQLVFDQSTATNTELKNQFDIVIDASGSNSALVQSIFPSVKRRSLSFGALWTTVPLEAFNNSQLEQRYVRAREMIGVLPCGTLPDSSQKLATLFYSLEKKYHAQWIQEGIDVWKEHLLTLWPETKPLLEYINSADQLTFAAYAHHTLKFPAHGRVIFIGDAAHATSPQLGQGANMAFLDAIALANAVKACGNNTDNLTRHYARQRRIHVRLYQFLSFLLTPLYQSNSTVLPVIRDISFKPATAFTVSNRLITRLGAGMVADPTEKLVTKYLRSIQ